MPVSAAAVLGWTDRPVDLSRLGETRYLGRSRVAGGETLPDHAWNQRDEPNLWDELRAKATR